ncbi:porin [Burkholderia contaminans]|uniref:porin n=1 Tax=Burkholderia contaminans TaxID=488447 RepID=UPI003D67BDFA
MKTKTRNGLLAAGACCALAAPGAHAQSSVTLYGIIDTGVEYVSHANAAGDHVVRMPGVTGELPSRWGLRGTEDLGGGYQAVFTLESGFNVRGGDLGQGGRLFGRQAFVGLKSGFGTLAFGRQYTMTYLALQGADIIGPDIYGLGSFDAYVPNGRADNAVTYVGAYRGVTFGAAYSFGRDGAGTGNSPGQGTCAGQVPGDAVQCRNWSVMLKYDSAYFGAAASYEEQRGGTGAAANFFDGVAPVPFTSSGGKDARTHVSAYAQAAGAKIGAGWIGRRVSTGSPAAPDAHSDLFFVGASYAVKPDFVVDGEGYRIVNSAHDTRATMATLRATYLLTKRTAVYAQSSYLWNSAHARYSVSGGGPGTTPGEGMGQLGAMVGVRHMF